MSSFKLLVIDTENKFVSTVLLLLYLPMNCNCPLQGVAKEIAEAAGGRYHYIPKASASALSNVASEAVASLKKDNR